MLIWERPEPPARSTPSPLDRERIVRAAMRLADADGLEAVSLRKVAAALDAGPMRLYRYVDTKEELLDLMVDAVYGEIRVPEPTAGDWRARVRSLARGTRDAALRHEWFADLLGGRPHLGPAAIGHLEATAAALRSAPGLGDDASALMRSMETVNAYVLGVIRHEIADRRAERASRLTEQQWQAAAGPYLNRVLASGAYPTLAHIVANAAQRDPAAAFDTGLDMLLEGIAAASRSGPGTTTQN
ncbi:TetR/AcrR family transcriptional regulator [Streptomyces sp. URMC 123]|uniref:TetR/AcrR family transcriptional regulator n=1 Tax=Streptomyces sp. URMC 123 TaxID=3423403 RepID=UPI003F1BFA63